MFALYLYLLKIYIGMLYNFAAVSAIYIDLLCSAAIFHHVPYEFNVPWCFIWLIEIKSLYHEFIYYLFHDGNKILYYIFNIQRGAENALYYVLNIPIDKKGCQWYKQVLYNSIVNR